MPVNPKLTKVLEHLIKNNEEEARKLLRQVFIEKARAIHEELMNADEEDMDESVGGSGDEGVDLTAEIQDMDDEIDFEQTMSEEETDVEVGDEVVDGDDSESFDANGSEEVPSEPVEIPAEDVDDVESKMQDLESALDALKAKFNSMNGGDEEKEIETVDFGSDDDSEGGEDFAVGDEEEVVDENWATESDFDDLAESLDLEVVEKDVTKKVAAKDVGSASSGMSNGNDAKSPVAKSQAVRMGAKPVEVKGPNVNGYERPAAPKADKLPVPASPTRKKSTDTTTKVSKEGDSAALLNKGDSEGNKMSPLSKGGDNLK